jgi:hypothetical protein
MVIVNCVADNLLVHSKVLVVKSEVEYPDPVGAVTEVKVNKSPWFKECPDKLTVTVVVPLVVKVPPVCAVSKGVMS